MIVVVAVVVVVDDVVVGKFPKGRGSLKRVLQKRRSRCSRLCIFEKTAKRLQREALF